MQLPDLANGLFETAGGIFVWMNAAKLWRDRMLRGVYWPAQAVFAAWGLWNLYYYPHLGQWLSFAGGCVIVTGNFAWVTMAIRWRNK